MEKNSNIKDKLVNIINSSLSDTDSVAKIHEKIKGLIESGNNREEIYKSLREYRVELQKNGNEVKEDIVVNVLTFFIDGWSTDKWKL